MFDLLCALDLEWEFLDHGNGFVIAEGPSIVAKSFTRKPQQS